MVSVDSHIDLGVMMIQIYQIQFQCKTSIQYRRSLHKNHMRTDR